MHRQLIAVLFAPTLVFSQMGTRAHLQSVTDKANDIDRSLAIPIQSPENAGVFKELGETGLQSAASRQSAGTRQVVAGTVITATASSNLQSLIDGAQPGDTIVLPPDAVYVGNFVLPKRSGDGYTTITTGQPANDQQGLRVQKSDTFSMPKLLSPNTTSALTVASGAHHWQIVGIELGVQPGGWAYNIVTIGTGAERRATDLPNNIILRRVYVHGDPTNGSKNGITLNGRAITVSDSYFDNIKSTSVESHNLVGWNGPGPFVIENNYLEGAAIGIMFGGAVPSIYQLVPGDITVRRNHFRKLLNDPFPIKNHFELKNARRVVVEQNVFENCWENWQAGFAILLTVRNENGIVKWAVIEDVTIKKNLIINSDRGILILGADDNLKGGTCARVVVANNLFVPPALRPVGTWWMLIVGPVSDLTIDHNTAATNYIGIHSEGAPWTVLTRLSITNNILGNSITGQGMAAYDFLAQYAPNATVVRNVVVDLSGWFPPNNFVLPTAAQIGFRNAAEGDFRLQLNSPYLTAATDGTAVGADVESVLQDAGTVVQQ